MHTLPARPSEHALENADSGTMTASEEKCARNFNDLDTDELYHHLVRDLVRGGAQGRRSTNLTSRMWREPASASVVTCERLSARPQTVGPGSSFGEGARDLVAVVDDLHQAHVALAALADQDLMREDPLHQPGPRVASPLSSSAIQTPRVGAADVL
ncbi:hypothetical protein [Enhygromyxa salina]|uniref:hypothetical protein n=1 Tax=Enhygromyxa salina TaxID=215803 RepID=UPI000D094CF9|nr:hypothetical protein [Enhygromyxa salina]